MSEPLTLAAQRAIDLLTDLVIAVALHQVGSIRDHADPNDKTGWNVHGIETCDDLYCTDGVETIAALRAALDARPLPAGDDRDALAALSFAEFAAINRARCEAPDGFGHPVSGWSLSDWMLAATGEFGEAANVAKKLNRVRDGIPGNTQTPEELHAALADEFADAVIYLDLAAQSQGIDLGTAVVSKFNRTSEKIGAPHRLAAGVTLSRPAPETALDVERLARAYAKAADETVDECRLFVEAIAREYAAAQGGDES